MSTTDPASPFPLDDVVPEGASFHLKSVGEVALRPVDLADEIWMRKTFGPERLRQAFDGFQLDVLARIVFRVMTPESRALFAKRRVTLVNEEGDQAEHEVGGVDLLMACVSGLPEKTAMVRALLRTLGFSRPALEKLAGKEACDEMDRTADRAQKKSP
jgi:hypothetical protein